MHIDILCQKNNNTSQHASNLGYFSFPPKNPPLAPRAKLHLGPGMGNMQGRGHGWSSQLPTWLRPMVNIHVSVKAISPSLGGDRCRGNGLSSCWPCKKAVAASPDQADQA